MTCPRLTFTVSALALLAACTLGSTPLHAAVDTLRVRVLRILVRGRAPRPQFWRRVGDQGQQVLVDLATDLKSHAVVRARALACLVYYPNRRSEAVLTSILADHRRPAVFRAVALQTLAAAFGAGASQTLKSFIYHRDPKLRTSAAFGLRFLPRNVARRILTAALSNEQSISVRNVILSSLATLDKRK